MSHYESELKVKAPAKEIFDFVKVPENMPKYLPTVHGAHGQGEGRVEMEGEAAGHEYKSDGWFKVDEGTNAMTWGSDGEHKYSGRLDVRTHEDHSHISVSLDFEPNSGQEATFDAEMGGRDAAIQKGLDAALESIRNRFEGNVGKEPTPEEWK